MHGSSGKSVILSAQQVRAWEDERTQLTAENARLMRAIEVLEKKITAGTLILGLEPDDGLETEGSVLKEGGQENTTESDQGSEDENMADASKRILGASRHALSNQELIAKLREVEYLRERLDKNPGYYYTMIGRLTKRGEVVKFRKKLKLPGEGHKAKEAQVAGSGPSLFE